MLSVLTTSLGQGPNGPFIPEVLKLFPDVPVIDRPGIISVWDDPKFVAAIEKTGRKNLIMAGVTVDVCLAFAAMQAVEAGYTVYGVVDASGALEATIRENAVARMRDHGTGCCTDPPGGAQNQPGVEARPDLALDDPLAPQAEPRPPPPHPQAEAQGHELARLRRQPAPARQSDGLVHGRGDRGLAG
jgi:hypothetical protein